jgi:hypothetical protein
VSEAGAYCSRFIFGAGSSGVYGSSSSPNHNVEDACRKSSELSSGGSSSSRTQEVRGQFENSPRLGVGFENQDGIIARGKLAVESWCWINPEKRDGEFEFATKLNSEHFSQNRKCAQTFEELDWSRVHSDRVSASPADWNAKSFQRSFQEIRKAWKAGVYPFYVHGLWGPEAYTPEARNLNQSASVSNNHISVNAVKGLQNIVDASKQSSQSQRTITHILEAVKQELSAKGNQKAPKLMQDSFLEHEFKTHSDWSGNNAKDGAKDAYESFLYKAYQTVKEELFDKPKGGNQKAVNRSQKVVKDKRGNTAIANRSSKVLSESHEGVDYKLKFDVLKQAVRDATFEDQQHVPLRGKLSKDSEVYTRRFYLVGGY